MDKNVRVRFAPSPTGPLHIGGVRTALFNYLFAKKNGGTFVLRIEDTDQNRYVEGAEDYIIESLNWCGIPFDEGPGKEGGFGPYRQSERKHLYKRYADELISKGKAYYAFDTPEELAQLRSDCESNGETFIYNWSSRSSLNNSINLSVEETNIKIQSGEPYVVRFLSPKDETLHLTDIVRGDIEIDTSVLDDKVLFKADGMPTYHLANIVDDHLMEITHVIRGEEWLPSLSLHFQLYKAFGWNPPEFAHLPLILKPTGKGKLSKRDGDKLGFPVFPLEWQDPKTGDISSGYKEEGYFPEAVVNFLALLGWNPGTEQEIFSLQELVESFDLGKVNKSGARFDPDKTKWFNHHYMREQNDYELAKAFRASRDKLQDINLDYISLVVGLVKERATFVSDLWDLTYYFFVTPEIYDEKATKKAFKEGAKDVLKTLSGIIESTVDYTTDNIQNNIRSWITSSKIGFGNVMMPLRLSLVGSLQGPDVFEIMFLIGRDETLKRINNAIKHL